MLYMYVIDNISFFQESIPIEVSSQPHLPYFQCQMLVTRGLRNWTWDGTFLAYINLFLSNCCKHDWKIKICLNVCPCPTCISITFCFLLERLITLHASLRSSVILRQIIPCFTRIFSRIGHLCTLLIANGNYPKDNMSTFKLFPWERNELGFQENLLIFASGWRCQEEGCFSWQKKGEHYYKFWVL
jgi:hypothetical protein